ncbi:CheR family methyltransferase [Aliishimia ponticola]|nr:CheR family methyltransferase [Aliishimia ponticola]
MDDGDRPGLTYIDPAFTFPVVGIGASAGGLEAVTKMFQSVDFETGMAFVLVLHLDPNHESLIVELLARKTPLKVRQIEDGSFLEPDTVHVIPPGASLELQDGTFRLTEFSEPRGLRRPIDSFFKSLAEVQGDRAAAVVLSGTGADGSVGIRAIKEHGGVCVSQDGRESAYDGMPLSAQSTGLIDFVLPAEQIVDRVFRFFNNSQGMLFPDDADDAERAMLRLFDLLRQTTGHDFSGYKRSTLFRRVERRMQLLELSSIEDYYARMQSDVEECQTLCQDFLINVTAFFRDPEAYDALRDNVIVPLVEKARNSDEIRIWVPGCSSGQEAYSVAMLVDDVCEKLNRRPLVQIFGTDIDEQMIGVARNARYPTAVFSEIPKKYQDAYTVGLDTQFEIVRSIRDMVRFSTHSLIADAPFSKIDLICCRNLLIYFGDEVQREVLPLFHFSLKQDGYLFLGTSENVSRREDLFTPIIRRMRIFRRTDAPRRAMLNLPLGDQFRHNGIRSRTMPKSRDFPRHKRLDESNLEIYERFAPPFVRVAEDGRIIASSGDLSLYLESRPVSERDLSTLAKPGLRDIVIPFISECVERREEMALQDIDVVSSFGTQKVDVFAYPLPDESVALIFHAKEALKARAAGVAVQPASRDRRIHELQRDLNFAREELHSKVEEIETANEELKSSNEEMMSMNEELQSANEELTTANEELKNKIEEVSVANADLENFMRSSDLPMIVLDRTFRIRHFTEATVQAMPIKESDRGRYISELNLPLKGLNLREAAQQVLDSGEAVSLEVTSDDERQSYLAQIRPYIGTNGHTDGVTLVLVDVTEMHQLKEELRIEAELLNLSLEAGRMGLADLDVATGTVTINNRFASHMGLPEDAPTVTLDNMKSVMSPQFVPVFESALDKAIKLGESYEFDFTVKQAGKPFRWIRTRGMPHEDVNGDLHVVGPTLDVTNDKLAVENREVLIAEMSHRVKNLFAVISALVQAAPKKNPETIDFASALISRIAALGDAYDLARKQDNLANVDLKLLLDRVIAPHRTVQKFDLKGPTVTLGSEGLTTLTLLFHELATNALKYGALSKDGGSLKVEWSKDDNGRLSVNWLETVPGFEPQEERVGFGSKLIDMAMLQLKAEVHREFADTGLKLTLAFDMEKPADA